MSTEMLAVSMPVPTHLCAIVQLTSVRRARVAESNGGPTRAGVHPDTTPRERAPVVHAHIRRAVSCRPV
jgi:hypothetical protein